MHHNIHTNVLFSVSNLYEFFVYATLCHPNYNLLNKQKH